MTVQVYKEDTLEVVASVDIDEETKGIVKDGYAVMVDGVKIE